MTDKIMTCRDCGSEFVFSVGEQDSTKKKDSITSHQDVCLVEELRNNNKIEDNFEVL